MAKYLIHIHTWMALFVWGVLAVACSEELQLGNEVENDSSSEVQFLIRTVGNGSVEVSRANEFDATDPRNFFPIGKDFVDGKSRIRICSVDRNPPSGTINTNTPNMDKPFTSMDEPTCYHEYVCKEKKEFDEYSIFIQYENAVPLKWDEVDADGNITQAGNILRTTLGGGYYMYAAMFPYVYDTPAGSTQDKRSVGADQTYREDVAGQYGSYAANLLMNDFRLCYKMFGRDNFRAPISLDFYHALCMLVVNVEIPLFDSEDGSGFKSEDIADANFTMSIENIHRNFKANYTRAYDKYDCVEVITSQSMEDLGKIRMFHSPNFSNPIKTDSFESSDAYWDQNIDHEGKPRPVRWTQFCAILPPQHFSDTGSFISFTINGKEYRCSLSGSPAIPLQQTYVTTLTLYIPRGKSDPVIAGAHLTDWKRKRTPIISLQ